MSHQKYLYIICAYMMRVPIDKVFQKDVEYMMENCPRFIDVIFSNVRA